MSNLDNPFLRITNSDGRPRAGTLAIYDEGTTNLSSVYSEKTLATPLTNPVQADAAGFLPAIFLAAGSYKLIEKDEDGSIIRENDHYVVPDLAGLDTFSFPVIGKSADFTVTAADFGTVFEVDATGGAITVTMDSATVGNGVPVFIVKKDSSANSVILSAGGGQTFNGGNSTYSLTQQHQCAGVASQGAAGWRIFLLPAPTSTPIRPQGRLTLVTGTPVITSDQTAKTTVYYTAFEGNYVPLWDGTAWQVRKFSADLSLALDNNSGHAGYHQALKVYDFFVADDNGITRFGTGPAWSVAGNYVSAGTLTTGTAARGTGAGTTELERTQGVYVNKNAITLRYGSNSGDTVSIAAGKATYLGSIWIDATDGQVSCHVSWGQNRKWGVWNAYNRARNVLLVGDSTASWAYNTNTFRASNNTAANSGTVLCGLPEELIDAQFVQRVGDNQNGANDFNGIGVGSTTTQNGQIGQSAATAGAHGHDTTITAKSVTQRPLGLQSFTCLEKASGNAGNNFYGTNDFMQLVVVFNG